MRPRSSASVPSVLPRYKPVVSKHKTVTVRIQVPTYSVEDAMEKHVPAILSGLKAVVTGKDQKLIIKGVSVS